MSNAWGSANPGAAQRIWRWAAAALAAILVLIACSPSPGRPEGRAGSADTGAAPALPRTLVAAIRLEPSTLALRPLRETFASPYLTNRTFNADIAVVDDQAVAQPYLVEALPLLNSETWRVFPDGRMETTYRLRANLAWHDGVPLSAEDFVFGWRVYTAPDLGLARTPPYDSIDDVSAPDPRTFVIRWARAYPDAAHMTGRDRQFPALPRHVLAPAFETESTDSFSVHAYWSREYLGLGPFKIVRWEPGAFIETVAFDAHALGQPKIDRLKLLFIPDQNTALSSALADEVQLLADQALETGQGVMLRNEWGRRQAGHVLFNFPTWRGINFQFRQAFVRPEALLDLRVRRALAHAVDKPLLNEHLYDGAALLADFIVPPQGQWGLAAAQGVTSYPHDLRRTEQLLREAGFDKGPDAILRSPIHGRFTAEMKTTAGSDSEAEMAAIADGWRTAGFDIVQSPVPSALAQDLEVRAAYSGMYLIASPGSERTVVSFRSDSVPMPENRWRGINRSGWSSIEYSSLAERFNSTLDVPGRKELLAQMARIFTDDVAAISLFFRPQVWAHAASVHGPHEGSSETNLAWDMHRWELR
jgi:peptide/nickel transport system substrate-binding protein